MARYPYSSRAERAVAVGQRGAEFANPARSDAELDVLARVVNRTARDSIAEGDGFGERKAFISDACPTMSDEDLESLRRSGRVKFARADLVAAMDASKVEASARHLNGAIVHFVVVEPDGRAELVDNPAWLTDAVGNVWDVLQKKVPPEWLPKLSSTKGSRGKMSATMKEYGCGVYGCVIPTLDDDVVLKATTDKSETEFATSLANTLPRRIVVEYHLVVALKATHKKQRVSLLWRESAQKVGELSGQDDKAVEKQHAAAAALLQTLVQKQKSPPMVKMLREAWLKSVSDMEKRPALTFLAEGMRLAANQGVLLLDVHSGNLGLCQRGDGLEWVITDPGNVVVEQ